MNAKYLIFLGASALTLTLLIAYYSLGSSNKYKDLKTISKVAEENIIKGENENLNDKEVYDRIKKGMSNLGASLHKIEPKYKRSLHEIEFDNNNAPRVMFNGGERTQDKKVEDIYIWNDKNICLWYNYSDNTSIIYSSYCKEGRENTYLAKFIDTEGKVSTIQGHWGNTNLSHDETLKRVVSRYNSLVVKNTNYIKESAKRFSKKRNGTKIQEYLEKFDIEDARFIDSPSDLKSERLVNQHISSVQAYGELLEHIKEVGVLSEDISVKITSSGNRALIARRDLNQYIRMYYNESAYAFMPINCNNQTPRASASSVDREEDSDVVDEDVVTEAILNAGGPPPFRLEGCGCLKGSKIQPSKVQVLELGRKQQGGPSDSGYWPVRVRVQGRCLSGTRDCRWIDFSSGRVEYIVWKNPYGEWTARFELN